IAQISGQSYRLKDKLKAVKSRRKRKQQRSSNSKGVGQFYFGRVGQNSIGIDSRRESLT
ncbi:hypothetical protein ACZ87_03754, partial [Candidatus Erwinia dacicola]